MAANDSLASVYGVSLLWLAVDFVRFHIPSFWPEVILGLCFAAHRWEEVGAAFGADVFRLGGDEFLALLPTADLKTAQAFVAKLQEELGLYGGQLSFSLGFAPVEKGKSPAEALAQAETAMYAQKKQKNFARSQLGENTAVKA